MKTPMISVNRFANEWLSLLQTIIPFHINRIACRAYINDNKTTINIVITKKIECNILLLLIREKNITFPVSENNDIKNKNPFQKDALFL